MLNRLLRSAVCTCLALLAACDPGAADDPNATLNISASISGLQGTLVLFNSGVGVIGVTGSGDVTIATHVLAGSTYNFTIARQPQGQTCTLANGSGIVSSDMNTVLVTCTAATYPVNVTVSGLSNDVAGNLVLSNNGSESLAVNANGSHAFSTNVTFGNAYNVAVETEPVGHACSVSNGAGTAAGDITDIQVQCAAVDPMMIRELTITATAPKFLRVSWQQVPDATYYRLLRDADGIPGGALVQVATTTTDTFATDRVAVHLRTLYIYVVEACDAMHCVASVPVDTTGMLTQAVGYLKADWSYWSSGYFGWAAALSSDGHTLAVGSTGLGAYVFVRPANYWKQQARIALTAPGNDDPMGISVTLSADGRTLAAGVRQGTGGLRVYTRTGGIWSLQAAIAAPANSMNFGWSSALSADGNTLVVGDMAGWGKAGLVYVYTRQGESWSAPAILSASNSHTSNLFGSGVAISADANTLVVGARGELGLGTGVNGSQQLSSNANASHGAAYVFVRSGANWVQQAYIKANATTLYSFFGKSVALSSNGNVLAVGAPGDNNARTGINKPNDLNYLQYSGAAYVFTRSDTTWVQQAYIKAFASDEEDYFGHSVSLSGDGRTLAVGAPHEDSAGNDLEPGMSADDSSPDSGAAYIFTRTGSLWRQHRYIKAPVNSPGSYFGYTVALSNDSYTLAVGAIYESGGATGINGAQGDNSVPEAGATYLY